MEVTPLGLYIAGSVPHLTIQAAINAAATNPRAGVWINANYNGTDTYTNPSGVPIFDLRGTGSISLTATSTGQIQRPTIAGATALVSGNFALSGWGSGATITAIHGSDAAHSFTITAGSSPSVSPTVILTYADGAWAFAPIVDVAMVSGTGIFTDIKVTGVTTAYTLTYSGLPISGSTYIFRASLIQPVS